MAALPVGTISINWNIGNISNHWSDFLDYIIPTHTPIDASQTSQSSPFRWTAVQQPEPTWVPRFARLDPSLPDRVLAALNAFLTDPAAFGIDAPPLLQSDISDTLATRLDFLPRELKLAGRDYSGQSVTADVRTTITGVALVAMRGIARTLNLVDNKVVIGESTQPNSWSNDWTMKSDSHFVPDGHFVLVGQDHSFDTLRNMKCLQSGLVLDSTSTQEGLGAILIQLGRRMRAAKVRFGLLFSSVAFRIVEIDYRPGQPAHTLLVSPLFWLSSEHPEDFETTPLETKPLVSILTAMVLAGLHVIRPATCDLVALGPPLQISTATKRKLSPEPEEPTSNSQASREQVLAFQYSSPGITPAVRVLRRVRVLQSGEPSRCPVVPLPESAPALPADRTSCPALGALPDPPGLPATGHAGHLLTLHEHVVYDGCLEAWRGTLNQTPVLAKIFLHDHVGAAYREARVYERRLSGSEIECIIVPRYLGTYTFRGEFYLILLELEDTMPKPKAFSEFSRPQRETLKTYARTLHGSGLGFPASASQFTRTKTGDIRIVDFANAFEHECDPDNCPELQKLFRLLDAIQ
ncbi:hypothetical protein BC834DRAFT_972100 [Gloeopeniophorella convolvens]|nr:hypothetical protein BC834DRAFT_972100 [Gloeopeniophorella convolvens]